MNEPTPFAGPRTLRGGDSGGAASVAYGDDAGWIVTFREEPEFMEYLSKQSGAPVYRNRLMTNMISPGNTKTIWDHPTTGISYEMTIDPESGEVHTVWEIMEQCENGDSPEPLRFPNAWARFLKKTTTAVEGFPIEEWGVITKTYAASLKAQNIHTLQQLANLSDMNAQSIMGAIKYRDLAKAALDDRAKTRILSREQERASQAEEKNALLTKQVAELQEAVLRLQAERSTAAPSQVFQGDRAPAAHAASAPQLRQLSTAQAKKQRAKAAAPMAKGLTGPDDADAA